MEKDFENLLKESKISFDYKFTLYGRFVDYNEFDEIMTYKNFISLKEPVVDVFLYLYTDSPYQVIYEKELPEILESLKSDKFECFDIHLKFYKRGIHDPYYIWDNHSD